MTSAEKAKALIAAVRAVADTIKEVGECPAGPLYLAMSCHGCTLTQFDQIMAILVEAKLIRRTNDLLIWIGPK